MQFDHWHRSLIGTRGSCYLQWSPLLEYAKCPWYTLPSDTITSDFYIHTMQHTHINKDTTNICSHINLIIRQCTIIDCFNKSVTLASTDNELPEDGDCTETCRSYFNVNFNTVFKTITCAFVGEYKILTITNVEWHINQNLHLPNQGSAPTRI
jgi:hypothetical protein